jgi:hypothetical protein
MSDIVQDSGNAVSSVFSSVGNVATQAGGIFSSAGDIFSVVLKQAPGLVIGTGVGHYLGVRRVDKHYSKNFGVSATEKIKQRDPKYKRNYLL